MIAAGVRKSRFDPPFECWVEEVKACVHNADDDVRAALGQPPRLRNTEFLEERLLLETGRYLR